MVELGEVWLKIRQLQVGGENAMMWFAIENGHRNS
jgi:hypothetical protein